VKRQARHGRQLLLLGAVASLAACPATASAATSESYSTVVTQIKTIPLVHAVINPKGNHVEIKYPNGTEYIAVFPQGGQPALQRLLHERHIKIIFASRHQAKPRPAPVHHHLRYIAGGILLGAIAVIGGVLLYRRRRNAAGSDAAPA
jgi:hypothetical protein